MLCVRQIIFLMAAVMLFSACKEETKQSGPSRRPKLQVEGVIAVPRRFENKFIATANLLPYEEVELRAPVSGTVLSIHFDEGQRVKKGAPLIHIDDRVWKAQIRGLNVQLEAARRDLKRKQDLFSVEGVSEEEVEQSQAEVDRLLADIETLRVNVNLANVNAPFGGRVGLRNFSIGSYMTAGQPITQLVQTDKLKVDFNLSSRYLDEVVLGSEVRVISSGDTVLAKVYAISPFVTQASRTAQVRAVISNNVQNFIPGDFAEVELTLNVDNEALVVPTDVVIAELNAQTVYVYRSGMAERREVLLGPRNETEVQILSGLEAGDTVLTTGLIQARDLLPVEIISVTNPVRP